MFNIVCVCVSLLVLGDVAQASNQDVIPSPDLSAGSNHKRSPRQTLIEQLFDAYDERIPPNFDKDGPTEVSLQLFILSIDTISESNMDFSVSMFLRQSWHDSRLQYNKFEAGNRTLELDTKIMNKVWVPDLFMPSEKRASVHDVTIPNKLMHVYHDGKIMYSQRISATLKCNFDLRKFPFDTQHCVVEMESYGYTIDTLTFMWSDKPIQTSENMKVPQFENVKLETSRCDKTYYGVGYTCLRFDIYMDRSRGYYITQVYLPSFLIVFLSWVSFWLDVDAVPARISLGLLTVLTMTTQSSGARQNLPKVSYVKAIDVWMAMCLLFVFLALVQFAYVNVLSRVEKRRKTSNIQKVAVGQMMIKAVAPVAKLGSDQAVPDEENEESTEENKKEKKQAFGAMMAKAAAAAQLKQDDQGPGENKDDGVKQRKTRFGAMLAKAAAGDEATVDKDVEMNDDANESRSREKSKFFEYLKKKKLNLETILSSDDREKARNVDRISRLLFPGVFLVFNIIYWCVYTFWEPESNYN